MWRCRTQPRNNCWLLRWSTSSCSQPGSAGLWQGQGWLLLPCQSVAQSNCPFHLQPEKAPSPLIISLPTKPSNGKGWLSLHRGGWAWPQQQLATLLLKTFGSRPPKGQSSPAPSLPNYCQELAASAFTHNRCKASAYPRAFIPLGRHKFG